MDTDRPGFSFPRLVELMRAAVQRCQLDLHGAVVLTEAATGAYVVTPVLAAMAEADRVLAVTHDSRYGTVGQVKEQTYGLASLAGVSAPIEVFTAKSRDIVAQADIVTNSGHLRPIDKEMVGWMKPTAVIPLMYEAWEFRSEDVDVEACRERGIAVAGTNERHPDVDVFSFLGVMAIKLLVDAGVPVYASRVLLLCDNSFAPFIARGLIGAGAHVDTFGSLALAEADDYDTIMVAMQPGPEPVLSGGDADRIARLWPTAVVAQFWGDIDRVSLSDVGTRVWPREAPASGHMGILPSAIGPEPVVRLQAGGLKVGQIMADLRMASDLLDTAEAAVEAVVISGFGQPVLWEPHDGLTRLERQP